MYFSLSRKNMWIFALVSQMTVFLTLLIFEPFRIYEHPTRYKILLSFSFSMVPTLVIVGISWFYLRNPKRKKVYTNAEFLVIFIGGLLVSICVVIALAYFIMIVLFHDHFRWPKGFTLSLVSYTVVFALIIFFIARSLDLFTFFLKNKRIEEGTFRNEKLEINSINYYSLSIQNILFIESENNNLRVHICNGNKTESVLIEYYTLKKIEVDYGYPKTSLFRCHKSYIINISNLDYIRGNARSTVTKLNQGFVIPVSRNRRDLLIESVRNNNR